MKNLLKKISGENFNVIISYKSLNASLIDRIYLNNGIDIYYISSNVYDYDDRIEVGYLEIFDLNKNNFSIDRKIDSNLFFDGPFETSIADKINGYTNLPPNMYSLKFVCKNFKLQITPSSMPTFMSIFVFSENSYFSIGQPENKLENYTF